MVTKKSTVLRLTDELLKIHATDMAEKASNGYYGDFTSPLAMPITQLVNDLMQIGTKEAIRLAERAKEGEFDG